MTVHYLEVDDSSCWPLSWARPRSATWGSSIRPRAAYDLVIAAATEAIELAEVASLLEAWLRPL